jgi:serine/threonine protein phosphatase PrpC
MNKSTHNIMSNGVSIALASCQGVRPEQEDADVAVQLDKGHTLVGVFDGHGGALASTFSAENFADALHQTPSYRCYMNDFRKDSACSVEYLGEAIKDTYKELDRQLEEKLELEGIEDSSGTTGCILIITPNYILCGNAGDSRCVLSVDGFTKALSRDHKPDDAKEKERIESAGGKVVRGRIDGELAVSRAIGDFKFKASNQQHEGGGSNTGGGKVVSTPDISTHIRGSRDQFLVLACDGLWDVYSSTEVLLQVSSLLNSDVKTNDIPGAIIDLAIANGSQDNVSVAVCNFLPLP